MAPLFSFSSVLRIVGAARRRCVSKAKVRAPNNATFSLKKLRVYSSNDGRMRWEIHL